MAQTRPSSPVPVENANVSSPRPGANVDNCVARLRLINMEPVVGRVAEVLVSHPGKAGPGRLVNVQHFGIRKVVRPHAYNPHAAPKDFDIAG